MKTRMSHSIKYNFIWIAVCVFALLFPINVKASAETKASASLTLKYEAGVADFSIYKIADFSEKSEYHLVEPFTGYRSKVKGLDELNELDSEEFRNLAISLENQIIADKIKATAVKRTNAQGIFEWENIPKGLYLILGSQTKDEKYIYTPSPIMVTIPGMEVNGVWNSHVVVEHHKLEKEEIEKQKETTRIQVIKIWKDKGYKEKRPSEVKIELLRDGKTYDTVKLNAKNNWKHQWSNLSTDYKWTVAEKNISSDYRVEYTKSGNKVYVINYHKMPEKPEKPKEPKPPSTPEISKVEKLPQTGQLWWPVPILTIFGIGLWMIGWNKRRTLEDV